MPLERRRIVPESLHGNLLPVVGGICGSLTACSNAAFEVPPATVSLGLSCPRGLLDGKWFL